MSNPFPVSRTIQLPQVWCPPGPDAPVPSMIGPERPGYWNTYPYPQRANLTLHEREDLFPALQLENEFLILTVVPSFGPRLFSLFDKTTGREVFHRPSVIRPSPILLRGAFAPFGVELNFPCGHTVHAFENIPCRLQTAGDGTPEIHMWVFNASARIEGHVVLSLRRGERVLRQTTTFRNLLPVANGMMYWANAAVINTPGLTFQVRAPMCHFFAGYDKFPFFDGADGRISCNRRFASDLFAIASPDDWFGFYHPEFSFGALHISPVSQMQGKKFFTFGWDEFGFRWGRHFDAEPYGYVEIQAGILETQFEYITLSPFESRTVEEFWVPYHRMGDILYAKYDWIVARGATGLQLAATANRARVTVKVVAGDTEHEFRFERLRAGEPVDLDLPTKCSAAWTALVIHLSGEGAPPVSAVLEDLPPATATDIASRQRALDGDNSTEPGRLALAYQAFAARRFAEAERLLHELPDSAAASLQNDLDALRRQDFARIDPPSVPSDLDDLYSLFARMDALVNAGKADVALETGVAWQTRTGQTPRLLGLVLAMLSERLKTDDCTAESDLSPWAQGDPVPFTELERQALEWALTRSQGEAHLAYLLGCYWSRWNEMRAQEYWESCLRSDGHHAASARCLAMLLLRHRRDLPRCCSLLESAVQGMPLSVEVLEEAVTAHRLAGQGPKALSLICNVPESIRLDPRVLKAKADLLRDLGRYAEALSILENSGIILVWEGETTPHRCRLQCHVELGLDALNRRDWLLAKNHFEALRQHPEQLLKGRANDESLAIAFYHLGLWSRQQGLENLARDYFGKATAEPHPHPYHWPNFGENEFYAALAHIALGETEQARLIGERLADWPTSEWPLGHGVVPNESIYSGHLARARGFMLLSRIELATCQHELILRLYGQSLPASLASPDRIKHDIAVANSHLNQQSQKL